MKPRAKIFLSFFVTILLLSESLSAQVKEDRNAVTARLGVSVPSLEFSTRALELPGKTLNFKPDAPSKTFLSLAYDWFGMTVAGINPVSSERERTYGESKAVDYQFRFYFTNFSAEFFYQKYKGYYIENTQDVITGWDSSQQRRLYPDLSTEHRGISLTYIFNPQKYSMAAAFDQSVRQTEMGGTWLINASISQHLFNNPSPLIPTELAGTYGEFEKVESGTLTSLTLGGGGAYTFVMAQNYFISGLAMLDIGEQILKYQKTDGSSSNSVFGSQAHLKISLGYNGEKFISGASFAGDTSTYTIEKTELSFQTLELGIFLGTRF